MTHRKPNRINLAWVSVLVIAALIVGGYVLATKTPAADYTDFAQCLTEEGAVMYGTYWCSHCKAQKADFGDAFQYVDYVECTEDPDACTSAGIRGFPSWIIGAELHEGRQSFSTLSELTGCELPAIDRSE